MKGADPTRALRLERRLLAGIAVAALVLMAIAFHWGLPNVRSWNGDDISPDKPLRVLHDWLFASHKYPYLHSWLNLVLYLPWLAVVALRGQVELGCLPRLRSECFADPWRDMTVFLVLSRLLSVAMGVGVVLGTRRLALALHGERPAALLAAAIVAGSPVLIFFGHTGNLDVPATFWFTWSLVAAVSLVRRGAAADYALFGLLVACAITTKDPIGGAYMLPLLGIAGLHVARVRRESGETGAAALRRALADRRLWLLAGVIVVFYVAVQNVIFNFDGFVKHWRFWLVGGSPVYDELRSHSAPLSRTLWRLWMITESQMGSPMLLLCFLGLLYAASAAPATLWLLLPAVSYLGFSVLPAFLAPRLALPLLPILAVWGGLLASRALRSRAPAAAALLLAVAFAHEYASSLYLDLRMLADSRYEAEHWIAEHVPRDQAIAGLSAQEFLPRVARMGYEVRWYPIDTIQRGLLEQDGAEWALLNSGAYPGSDRAYLDDLRGGRLGYEVAYRAEGRVKPIRWLAGFRAQGGISPRVYVLRRRAPSELGAAEAVP